MVWLLARCCGFDLNHSSLAGELPAVAAWATIPNLFPRLSDRPVGEVNYRLPALQWSPRERNGNG